MYSKKFCEIYDKYGWDYFSLTFGKSLLKFFKQNNINIKTNLDIACGTGVLCDYFYKNNINTVGVDISPDMIDIANNKNENIKFYNYDILDYETENTFDLITVTCDAINHFLESKDLENLFNKINKFLNNNGYFVFDIYNNEKLDLNTEIISNRDDGVKVKYFITKDNNIINTNVKVYKNSEFIFEENVKEKSYDIDYITNLLQKNNFEIIQIGDKILDEEQRFKDKLYIICKKI